jgi:outer membrane cobalamin receptor
MQFMNRKLIATSAKKMSVCTALVRAGLFCAISLPTMSVEAKPADDNPDNRVQTLDTIEVTAVHKVSRITAAAPIQRMNKAEIERIGALSVSDAVRHFSGVSVKDYGGIGGLKTVSVRGLGAQHTAVSYDGVAIGDCQSGQVDISRFSLDNVSELTMTIGQADDIYQTAKMFASAGALSIETSRPEFLDKTYQLVARVKTGSYGMANPSLSVAKQLGERMAVTAYGEFLRADGNYRFKMMNGTKLIDAKRNNSDINSYRAEANLFATLSNKQDLKVKAYLFDSERGLPGGVIYDNPYASERLYDRNYFGQAKYENRFSRRLKLKASGKFNYSWNRDFTPQSSGDTDYHYRQTETYLSGTLWAEPVNGLSFSVANDFAYNYLSTTLPECPYPERFTLLTAVASHYQSRNVTATVSLLNTFIHENVKIGAAAADRKHLSPAASVAWKPMADVNWRVRASYQDIFRTPTFNDLYYLLIGNSKLRPEKTKQFNVGSTWSTSLSSVLDYLSVTADAFYGRVKDKIVAVPTMFVWRMSNVGKVETIGVDVNVAAELALSQRYKLFITEAYSFMQAEDITSRTSKVWRNQIAYTPKHSGSSSVTLQTPYVNVTANVLYSSERYQMAQNSRDNRIAPYADCGVSLSRLFKWSGKSLRLQFDALNLGNKNYEIVRFYPMAGRNYKLAITFQL